MRVPYPGRPTRFDGSSRSARLRAEWQPPEEFPEPAGPAEVPETEPGEPTPEPIEPPGSPEELPPARPESRLGHCTEVPEEPKPRLTTDVLERSGLLEQVRRPLDDDETLLAIE
jgi:hypothetical protein